MGSFSVLCIGLSFLFGCILMGLVAELYYLLCWKRRIAITIDKSNCDAKPEEIKLSFPFFFWKKHACLQLNSSNTVSKSQEQQDLEMCSSKNLEGMETELMRKHNLYGHPTYLFTIDEETMEELKSNDEKSRKGSGAAKTPFSADDDTAAAEISRLQSSPAPTFQFLKDAEDKLLRKILAQEGVRRKSLENQEHLQEYVNNSSSLDSFTNKQTSQS